MSKIPKFKTLGEVAKFWDTHRFADYVEDTVPVEFDVERKPEKETLREEAAFDKELL